METREEPRLAVLRTFGREPLVEDWRWVGRWAYAAAWISEDRAMARDVVRARLAGAAEMATAAAMAAGRGDPDRFVLVSAIARLKDAFSSSEGTLGPMAERAVREAAAQLVADGAALRSATHRERAALAPRFGLEGFAAAMLDVGSERNVLLREAARGLDEALLTARGPCPALRTLRLFLRASLAADTHDAPTALEAPLAGGGDPVATLGTWLAADLALAARRAGAYEAAWSAAARASGDALSRMVAGLARGSMASEGLGEALLEEPTALLLALAMTSQAEHASVLLDQGAQAQAAGRLEARKAVARWVSQAQRTETLESRLGISILSTVEAREGHREHGSVGGIDLFSAWHIVRSAEDARSSLRESTARSVSAESKRRTEAVRRAKAALERAQRAYDAAIKAARGKVDAVAVGPALDEAAEESAQRGCVFGFGAGCGVMATYAVVGVVVGTGGLVGRVAPVVVGVAAIPVAAAVMGQVAVAARRAKASAAINRMRAAASAEYERVRAAVERSQGPTLASLRERVLEAEGEARELERRIESDATLAA